MKSQYVFHTHGATILFVKCAYFREWDGGAPTYPGGTGVARSLRPDEAVHVASLAHPQRPQAIRVDLCVRHLGEEHAPIKHDSNLVPLGGVLRRRVIEREGRRAASDALAAARREHVLQKSFRQRGSGCADAGGACRGDHELQDEPARPCTARRQTVQVDRLHHCACVGF